MSDNKKENLFAKLAQQNAKATRDDAATAGASPPEDTPPSPAPVSVATIRPYSSKKKAERVRGKRDNPDYCQANCYVPKTVRRAVDKALLDIEGLD